MSNDLLTDLTPEQLAACLEDAARWRHLVENNLTVLEVTQQRRGFRSTAPNACRETWTEHVGWTVSNLPIDAEYPSMAAAVDASRRIWRAGS